MARVLRQGYGCDAAGIWASITPAGRVTLSRDRGHRYPGRGQAWPGSGSDSALGFAAQRPAAGRRHRRSGGGREESYVRMVNTAESARVAGWCRGP